MVVECHHAARFINLGHLNFVLPLAFAQDVGFFLGGWLAGMVLRGDFEQHLQFAKDGHDAVGLDFGRRIGRRRFRCRIGGNGHQIEYVPRHHRGVGFVGRHHLACVRAGTGQQHGDQNHLSGGFHGFNITAGKVNTNGKSKLQNWGVFLATDEHPCPQIQIIQNFLDTERELSQPAARPNNPALRIGTIRGPS